MQFSGLALTLALLTSSFVAIDLTDVKSGSQQQSTSQASTTNDGINTLAIMPRSMPGVTIPNADIRNGVFALGSSTDKAGLDDDGHDVSHQEDDADEATDSPAMRSEKTNDFVLI